MGRIDDALRRSGAPDTTVSSTPSDGEVFVSAWPVSSAPEARLIEASPETPPEPVKESGGELLRDVANYRSDLLTVSKTADAELSGQFRRMAATLYNARDGANLKLVMVTSAGPGEGKTLSAMNLALILSESFRCRVLLIDADLRRPSIHRVWGVDGGRGLSDILRDGNEP